MARIYNPPGSEGSGLIRVLAPNPSPMTHHGTNSYVLGDRDVAVIDPGPADPDHLAALTAAIRDRPVRAILVTHSHLDHSPAAPELARRVGAPVFAFGPSTAGRSAAMQAMSDLGGGEGVDVDFAPDVRLTTGDEVAGDGWTLRAHHTPGHMANHLSYEWLERREAFTGDTVMGWASTMISPPDGDLDQFMDSLSLLESLDAGCFRPGHGEVVTDPGARCRALRAHREARSREILSAMGRPARIAEIVARVYADAPAALHPAAARNVLAHLIHLERRGSVAADPAPHPDAIWRRT